MLFSTFCFDLFFFWMNIATSRTIAAAAAAAVAAAAAFLFISLCRLFFFCMIRNSFFPFEVNKKEKRKNENQKQSTLSHSLSLLSFARHRAVCNRSFDFHGVDQLRPHTRCALASFGTESMRGKSDDCFNFAVADLSSFIDLLFRPRPPLFSTSLSPLLVPRKTKPKLQSASAPSTTSCGGTSDRARRSSGETPRRSRGGSRRLRRQWARRRTGKAWQGGSLLLRSLRSRSRLLLRLPRRLNERESRKKSEQRERSESVKERTKKK